MKTIEEINQLKYNMLTSGNALRGYSNCKAAIEVNRVEGELKKLEETYSDYVLSDDLKDAYIISEFNKLAWTVDDEEMGELLEDRPDDSYYNDASMNWIYDHVYNLFDDCETLEEIDDRISSIFGYYQSNYIVENGGQFYILFEWWSNA